MRNTACRRDVAASKLIRADSICQDSAQRLGCLSLKMPQNSLRTLAKRRKDRPRLRACSWERPPVNVRFMRRTVLSAGVPLKCIKSPQKREPPPIGLKGALNPTWTFCMNSKGVNLRMDVLKHEKTQGPHIFQPATSPMFLCMLRLLRSLELAGIVTTVKVVSMRITVLKPKVLKVTSGLSAKSCLPSWDGGLGGTLLCCCLHIIDTTVAVLPGLARRYWQALRCVFLVLCVQVR